MEKMIVTERVMEVIATAPQDVQAHLRRGKAHYEEGLYTEAIQEFEKVIKAAPGNIEARVWLRKVKDGLAAPAVEQTAATVGGRVKECLWQKLGMVSFRICTNSYDCLTCEFDQQMQEKMVKGEAEEIEKALQKFEQLPGSERVCRYALKGDVSYRLCSRCFQCATCEFDQMMEDTLQEKLAKLATRRDALKRKSAK